MALLKPEKNTKENVMCTHHHFSRNRSNFTQNSSPLNSQSPPSIMLNGGNNDLLNGLHLTCLLLGILNVRANNAQTLARPQSQPSSYSTSGTNCINNSFSSKNGHESNLDNVANAIQSKTL